MSSCLLPTRKPKPEKEQGRSTAMCRDQKAANHRSRNPHNSPKRANKTNQTPVLARDTARSGHKGRFSCEETPNPRYEPGEEKGFLACSSCSVSALHFFKPPIMAFVILPVTESPPWPRQIKIGLVAADLEGPFLVRIEFVPSSCPVRTPSYAAAWIPAS